MLERYRLDWRAAASLILVETLLGTGCGSSPTAPSGPSLSIIGAVSDTVSRAVAGARVELISGLDAGQFTTTDAMGYFTLKGRLAGGTLSFRITKAGFALFERTVDLSVVGQRVPLTLVPNALLNLAGTHTLTLTADPACSTLPTVAQSRSYNAFITPTSNPALLTIHLDRATFTNDQATATASVAADAVRFDLIGPYHPDLGGFSESLGGGTSFSFWVQGLAETHPGTDVVSGNMYGTIGVFGPGLAHAMCQSYSHLLTLTRQ